MKKKESTNSNSRIIANLVLTNTKDVIPIVEGTSLEDLKQGAGYYQRSSFPGERGNCIILGHRETFFNNLGELELNDKVVIETLEKKSIYTVNEIRIIDKIDESLLKQKNNPLLLLITCYPIKPLGPIEKRYLVIAELEY